MEDLKFIIAAASLAFIISFISGLLGSVSFGVLFFRAILGALIFAGLGFGMSIILRRFLPELFEKQPGQDVEMDTEVLEYSSETGDAGIAGQLSSSERVVDISIDDEDNEFAGIIAPSAGYSSEAASQDGGDLVEELEESDQQAGDTEEINPGPMTIDNLPDLGTFSESFEGIEEYNDGSGNVSGPGTLEIMGEEFDPEMAVKAVRTMVKKDQEG